MSENIVHFFSDVLKYLIKLMENLSSLLRISRNETKTKDGNYVLIMVT